MDVRFNTADDSSTSDKKFGEPWSSNSRVLQARLCQTTYTLDFVKCQRTE